ncbi:MAG: CDP-glycerol glycerophosphotransferase family protein, partial [Clostridia bacterium]|nr:CDP-glycerol glycerophosphotransferase family protein [Clostridia bacterium]
FLYALFFNLCRVFPVKENRVTFLSPHREKFTDGLGMVMREIESRGEYDTVKISSADLDLSSVKSIPKILGFFTKKAYLLATSKYVFLNDNFMPMGSLNFSKKAVVTQLWHAEGVFKKFGLHIPQPDDVRKRELKGAQKLTYVVCSSPDVAHLYAEAFGVKDEQVLPLGAPRADNFFKPCDIDALREKFYKKYPQCREKKLILYAPTFRDNPEDDKRLLQNLNVAAFNTRYGETSALLIRLHPQIRHTESDLEGAVDVTDYDDVGELTRLCDAMITDYSSVCMDAALIGKPLYFYAFDLDKYASDRQFYFDYETYVPGPVARDFDTLLNLLSDDITIAYSQKEKKFREFNFGNADGCATKRVVDYILNNQE